MSGRAETPKNPLGGFEETLKDFWVSRPRRPRYGRKVAGVAAGIGNRYGLDPVLVRVAFAAASVFGGIGLSLYVLCWLLFPAEGDEVSPAEALFGRGRSATSKGFTIVLAVVLFPLTSWAFAAGNGWFGGSGVIGLALLVAALYLLHRDRGQSNRPQVSVHPKEAAFSMTSQSSPTFDPSTQQPSGFDPLGASPLAWDLPDPEPPPPPPSPPAPPRRRSKVGVITFAAALLVAGASAAAGAADASWVTPGHVIGLALGVVGIGMVVGAFVRGGRGLIGLAIPLAIAGLVTTTIPFDDYRGGFGDLDARPLTAAEVQPVYQHTAGDITLDLSGITGNQPVVTEVRNGAGTTTVLLPENADVDYSCEINAGELRCFDQQRDGVHVPSVTGRDLGSDGPGGTPITVHVVQGGGNVEVHRG